MNAPVAQLCFGSGANELNLREVQKRVSDLIRVIDSMLVEMQTQGSHWQGFLDKLAVINMTHQQIVSELRPVLRQYTVYPKFVDNPGIENALPEMLASRLLPDQVEQEAAWRADLPGGLARLTSQPAPCYDYAEGQVAELKEMVGWLTNLQHSIRSKPDDPNPTPRFLPVGVLDPKGHLRREMEATSRQIALAAAAAEKGREQAGTALLEQPPQQQQQQQGAQPAQKRRKVEAAAAAAQPSDGAVAVPSNEAETDALLAKVFSGQLWGR